ncbi:MAG TPA: hypothetical protein VFP63_00080 [Dehalococcoidia bacterium]|nr:hypothetical protein [Dehalococcoidia bacterium]
MGSIPVANPAPYQRPHLSRRGLLVIALPLAFAALMAVVIAFAWPAGPKVKPAIWLDAGAEGDLRVSEPVRIVEGRFWLVKLQSGEILALYQRDPRNGCTIPWRPDFDFGGKRGWFRDPCHGSTYDIDGTRAFGPSPRSMDRYRVDIRGGQIFVDVGTLLCGSGSILPGSPCKLPAPFRPSAVP